MPHGRADFLFLGHRCASCGILRRERLHRTSLWAPTLARRQGACVFAPSGWVSPPRNKNGWRVSTSRAFIRDVPHGPVVVGYSIFPVRVAEANDDTLLARYCFRRKLGKNDRQSCTPNAVPPLPYFPAYSPAALHNASGRMPAAIVPVADRDLSSLPATSSR